MVVGEMKFFSFLSNQNFVIDLFLFSGDRMAGMWRAYQSLMSRYPWTVQIVTAGRKRTLLHICPTSTTFEPVQFTGSENFHQKTT